MFGDCSGQDVVSCCVAWKFPFLAYGWNQSRALGAVTSFWREVFVFLGLTAGIFLGLHMACCAMMILLCPEGARGPHGGHMHGDHMHGDHMHGDNRMPDSDDGPHGIPQECMARLAPAYLALAAVAITAIVMTATYFGRRRTAMRERFNIEGSSREDCLLYAFCTPCALAQETRTFMHEQVHEGVWYGALPGVHAPIALGVPQAQKMVPV
jgi:Cys-rich protein (TIGR01571 family)